MKNLKNMVFMYSTYSVLSVLFALFVHVPHVVLQVIQWNAFIVLFGVLLAYIRVGPQSIWNLYHEYIKTYTTLLNDHRSLYAIVDVLFHVLPAWLIGAPSHGMPWLFAYLLLLIWYFFAREHIQKLYLEELPKKDYDFIIYCGIPILSLGLFWGLHM